MLLTLRIFTEEAFLFSTFVEFNKCWSSGKKSRLVIESFNGFAFVNFSAFLGHPKTMHSAPREKRDPGRKSRKKSKRKTQRDNEITIEQPGSKKRNARREKRLLQKLLPTALLHIQFCQQCRLPG